VDLTKNVHVATEWFLFLGLFNHGNRGNPFGESSGRTYETMTASKTEKCHA